MRFRRMDDGDIPFAVDVTATEGWYLERDDFSFYLEHGMAVIAEEDRPVGLATAALYGELAWIGNVLILPEYRNAGAGGKLLSHLLAELRSTGARTVALYAYDRSRSLYERNGFHFDAVLWEVEIPAVRFVRHAESTVDSELISFDARYFKHDRGAILRHIASRKGARVFRAEGEHLTGYMMCSPSSPDYGTEIAPFIAPRSTALDMLAAAGDLPMPLHLYSPEENTGFLVSSCGARMTRRMHRGFIGRAEDLPLLNGETLSPGIPDAG